MATSLPNALVFETPYLRTTYLTKQGPGKWTVTCDVMKDMGSDESYFLHVYHHLRDWINQSQLIFNDVGCRNRKCIMFNIDLGIQNGKESS